MTQQVGTKSQKLGVNRWVQAGAESGGLLSGKMSNGRTRYLAEASRSKSLRGNTVVACRLKWVNGRAEAREGWPDSLPPQAGAGAS